MIVAPPWFEEDMHAILAVSVSPIRIGHRIRPLMVLSMTLAEAWVQLTCRSVEAANVATRHTNVSVWISEGENPPRRFSDTDARSAHMSISTARPRTQLKVAQALFG